jgi:hypothetical protein
MCYADTWKLTPRPWPVQLVFEKSSSNVDMLSATALRGVCELAEETHNRLGNYDCEQSSLSGNCCAARTLGMYAALLAGRSSCRELTDADADAFKARLRQCRAHTLSYQQIDLHSYPPPSPLPPCEEFNAVFDSFNALLDAQTVATFQSQPVADAADIDPNFIKLMLPHRQAERLKTLHLDHLEGKVNNVFGGAAKLTAYDLDEVKMALFSEVLFTVDMPQIAVGMLVVIVVTWLYSGSLLFTCLAFLQILMAVAMAFGTRLPRPAGPISVPPPRHPSSTYHPPPPSLIPIPLHSSTPPLLHPPLRHLSLHRPALQACSRSWRGCPFSPSST